MKKCCWKVDLNDGVVSKLQQEGRSWSYLIFLLNEDFSFIDEGSFWKTHRFQEIMAKYLQIPKGFVDPSDSNSHQTNNEK